MALCKYTPLNWKKRHFTVPHGAPSTPKQYWSITEDLGNGDDSVLICRVHGYDEEDEAVASCIAGAPAMMKALRKIRDARDSIAEGEKPPFGPDQAFDDWAADVAESALKLAESDVHDGRFGP